MSVRVLHVSDRACGFVGDTLRGLETDGFDVLSLDIRAFASQAVYDPGGFAAFDQLDWLKGYDPHALARLQWASVALVESGGHALSWITRAGLGIPIVARLSRKDYENSGIFLVDWSAVTHVVFVDQACLSLFRTLFPGVLEGGLSASVIPLHLADERFALEEDETRTDRGRSLMIVGDVSDDPGSATALQIYRHLAARGIRLEIFAGDTAPAVSPLAARRKALAEIAGRSSAFGRPALSNSLGQGPPRYILCASPDLGASASVAIHAAAGALPILRRGVTAAEEWLGPDALLYDDTINAAERILETLETSCRRSGQVRTSCGGLALMALRTVLHDAA